MKLALPPFSGLGRDRLDLGQVVGSVGTSARTVGESLCMSNKLLAHHMYIIGQSGSGKTGLLQAIAAWNILRRYPFCLIDPVGSLFSWMVAFAGAANLHLALQERTGHEGWDAWKRRGREQYLRSFVVLDFGDTALRWRFNPLEPQDGLSTDEAVGDFLRCLERVVGDLAEMRRLQLLLRAVCTLLARMGGTTLRDVPDFLVMEADSVRDLIARLRVKRRAGGIRHEVRPDLIEQYMSEFFASTSHRERRDYVSSAMHAISLFLTDEATARFVSSPTSNISFSGIVNGGHNLLVRLPNALDLNTQKLLGALILNRIQLVAERRSIDDVRQGRVPPFSCIVDEFQNFFTSHFSEAIARVRNVGLNFVVSHQHSKQPPFDTEEGQALLRAFKANASTHIYMRVGFDDAQDAAAVVFRPRGQMLQREEVELAESTAVSWARTVSDSVSRSISEAFADSASVTQTVSIGSTKSVGFSESNGVSQVKGASTTVTQGHNWSRAESHTTGNSVTITNSHTITEGEGRSDGRSFSTGSSTGPDGRMSSSLSRTISEVISRTRSLAKGQSHAVGESESESTSSSYGESESSSVGEPIANGLSLIKGTGETLASSRGNSRGKTSGRTHTRSRGLSASRATSIQSGGSHSRSQTTKRSYYSVDEEVSVRAYELAELPRRHAWVWFNDAAPEAVMIRTHDIPQQFVTRVGRVDYIEDFLRIAAAPHPVPEPTLRLADRVVELAGFAPPDPWRRHE